MLKQKKNCAVLGRMQVIPHRSWRFTLGVSTLCAYSRESLEGRRALSPTMKGWDGGGVHHTGGRATSSPPPPAPGIVHTNI